MDSGERPTALSLDDRTLKGPSGQYHLAFEYGRRSGLLEYRHRIGILTAVALVAAIVALVIVFIKQVGIVLIAIGIAIIAILAVLGATEDKDKQPAGSGPFSLIEPAVPGQAAFAVCSPRTVPGRDVASGQDSSSAPASSVTRSPWAIHLATDR